MECAECDFDWSSGPEMLISRLHRADAEFGAAIQAFDESALRTRPEPQVWSPLEYTAHVRDVMRGYGDRIRRVLEEERPQLAARSWSAYTEEQQYHREATADVLAGLAVEANALAALLSSLDDEQWQRAGIGSEGGDRTVLLLARRVVHEVEHHLMDIDRQVP